MKEIHLYLFWYVMFIVFYPHPYLKDIGCLRFVNHIHQRSVQMYVIMKYIVALTPIYLVANPIRKIQEWMKT